MGVILSTKLVVSCYIAIAHYYSGWQWPGREKTHMDKWHEYHREGKDSQRFRSATGDSSVTSMLKNLCPIGYVFYT